VTRGVAPAKLNLALVVGPRRADGKHELLTVYQRIALADRVAVDCAPRLGVEGFPGDTLVRRALLALADAASTEPAFAATIHKRIPVAAGLGGGSSDAATALSLANGRLLDQPLDADALHAVAASIGADVPFFLRDGPQLGSGDGTELEALDLPQDYWVLLVLPSGAAKTSTADVYAAFDARSAGDGFERRRESLRTALAAVRRPRDLSCLPPNDLASSQLADRLCDLGAFRADVSGAGPVVYGLFLHGRDAREAERRISPEGRTWVTAPAWYG
jgi:4-diphosphocytidyl-2-C-methyl-D-erythritol kinase